VEKIDKWNAYNVIMLGGVIGYDGLGIYRSDGKGGLIRYEWPGKGQLLLDTEFRRFCLSIVGALRTDRLKSFVLTSDICQAFGPKFDSVLCDALDAAIASSLQYSYFKMLSMDAGFGYSEGRPLLLNRSWISTPRDWTCPVCERGKKDLLFQDGHGVWRGELAIHHDHCTDEFGGFLVDYKIAFRDVLICSKCNTLEGVPKANGLVEKWFSYDWLQIKKFVIVNDDGSLGVDMAEALKIYERCGPLKKRLIDQALLLRQDTCAYSELAGTGYEPRWLSKMPKDGRNKAFDDLVETVYCNSNVAAGFGSMYPIPARKTFKYPNATEIESAVEKYESYAKLGDAIKSWRCSCCARSAGECVRFYPKNRKYKFRTSFVRLDAGKIVVCLDCGVSIEAIIHRNSNLDREILYEACCEHVEVRNNQPSYFDEEKILLFAFESKRQSASNSVEYIFEF